MQLGGFLGGGLELFLKTSVLLMKSLFKRLAKNIFRPLWLTAAISKADAGIHKKS